MLIKIICAFIVWTFAGWWINILAGYIGGKRLKKFYQTKQEMERDLTIRNYQEGCREPTIGDLILNAVYWPRTIYYAVKGHNKIRKSFEDKERDRS